VGGIDEEHVGLPLRGLFQYGLQGLFGEGYLRFPVRFAGELADLPALAPIFLETSGGSWGCGARQLPSRWWLGLP
jgi:hypothetical protein